MDTIINTNVDAWFINLGDCNKCGVPDSSEYTFVEYPIWKEKRYGPLRAANGVEMMTKGEVEWTAMRVRAIKVFVLKKECFDYMFCDPGLLSVAMQN